MTDNNLVLARDVFTAAAIQQLQKHYDALDLSDETDDNLVVNLSSLSPEDAAKLALDIFFFNNIQIFL